MPDQIVPQDRLRSAASELDLARKQAQAILSGLQKTSEDLEQHWKGPSQQTFFQSFRAWQVQMHNATEHVGILARQLEAIADRANQADR